MYIQMVTALVLQLIQCVVHLPNDKDIFDEYDSKVGEHTGKQIHLVSIRTRIQTLFSSTFAHAVQANLTSSFFLF